VTAPALKSRVEHALGGIVNPRQGGDVIASGMVRDLAVDAQGAVSFTFVLTRDDPGALARQVRKAVEGVPGVSGVKMSIVDAAAGGGAPVLRHGHAPRSTRSPCAADARRNAGTRQSAGDFERQGRRRQIHVSANLAAALARDGHRVGLMDADIYGPNIPRMFGANAKPEVQGGKIQPLEAHGVKLMSLGSSWSVMRRRSGAARSS